MIHWHILGAGAMGCLYAAFLARSGQQTTLLLRKGVSIPPEQTLVIDDQPIFQHVNFQTTESNFHPIKHLLVTTKAFEIANALRSIKHQITPQSTIILLNNGMGVMEELLPEFKLYNFIHGTSTMAAYRLKAFNITHTGTGTIWLGQLYTQKAAANYEVLTGFQKAGLDVQWEENILPRLWEKLVINAIINPLTALLNCKNGTLLNNTQLIHPLCEEATEFLLAISQNIDKQSLYEKVVNLLQQTANNYSSMHQDVHHNRRTEINYINKYLLDSAKKNNIKMPAHEFIMRLISLKNWK